MTPSGETMLRIKAMCVVGPSSERTWRNGRARTLATMLAWYRRPAHPAAKAQTKRIILEDIIPDIGWPRLSWLKPAVRVAQADIQGSLDERFW